MRRMGKKPRIRDFKARDSTSRNFRIRRKEVSKEMKNENLKDKNIKNGKLAVVFPGVGYHADKPLLYYSRKLAAQYGYEIICADYGILPSGIKGDAGKMYAAFEQALSHVEEQLASVDFVPCSRVLFLSKSIGTAVAAASGG